MGLDLDEYIYGKLLKYFSKRKKEDQSLLSKTVLLSDIKPRLTILARAISGKPINIYPAEREGGYKNDSFFLPVSFSLLEDQEQNKLYYLYRVIFLCKQQSLSLNWDDYKEHTLLDSRRKALEFSDSVLNEVYKEFNGVKVLHDTLKEKIINNDSANDASYSWMYGKWMSNDTSENNPAHFNDHYNNKKQDSDKLNAQTVLKAKAVEEIKTLTIDKKQQEDYVMTHNFEKVETAEEFNGNWRDFDGDDELADHSEALDELEMKYTVRVDDDVHSVYQADFLENITVSESSETGTGNEFIFYDEWNYKTSSYKKDYCKLYPVIQTAIKTEFYKDTLKKHSVLLTGMRKMLANINNKHHKQSRLTHGEEMDTDAITDLFVEVVSKRSPSENIYISKRKKEKDLSILLLLDISLSSDAYASNNRVIDVEKEVAILFGEILNEYNVDFSISCFCSKTRNHSSFITLKGFDESWSKSHNRVGAIEPMGYTRIGTALRHSGNLLEKREAKNKWLILISDGKPNDYDRYEGKHGINDVKKAISELYGKQVNCYSLAIESEAKYYLPQMFGQNHFQILTSTADLLTSMVKLYEKIKYKSNT